jgi:hypothetical protein
MKWLITPSYFRAVSKMKSSDNFICSLDSLLSW